MPEQEIEQLRSYLGKRINAGDKFDFLNPQTRLEFLQGGKEGLPPLTDGEISRLMIAQGNTVPEIFRNFRKI